MSRGRLTVVQMVPALESGGVERGTVELSEELARRGHRSLVISGGGKLASEIVAHGGEHLTWGIGVKSPLTFKWVWPLRRLLLREQVDILHARSRVPAWVAYFAWRSIFGRSRPHFVTTAHGLYSVNGFSRIMTSGERVIAISETVDDYLRRNYPRLNPDKIRVIPRGVDPDEFPRGFQPSGDWLDAWYQQYPQLLGSPVISLVGRITRCKGHPDFLKIVERLLPDFPNLQAMIVGGDDPNRKHYAQEVRALVRQMGLEQHVIFTGHRSDVREIYALSNVVLSLTSDPPEAFGRATIEALNIGTPVVGYAHSGTGEILRRVFPEGSIPPGDVDAAAAAIRRILTDGASVPSDHPYLKHRMLQQTLSVYEELAA